MNKLEHIGARIRLFRKHQNLTLEELAYMVHKSPSTICKYENGSVNIDILTMSEIAEALEIEITDPMYRRTVPTDSNCSMILSPKKYSRDAGVQERCSVSNIMI